MSFTPRRTSSCCTAWLADDCEIPFSEAPREKLAQRTTSQKIFNDSNCMPLRRSPFPRYCAQHVIGIHNSKLAPRRPVKPFPGKKYEEKQDVPRIAQALSVDGLAVRCLVVVPARDFHFLGQPYIGRPGPCT